MTTFTHFENGQFISENTYRRPDYTIGEFEDIFDAGRVVVSLGVDEIRAALEDGELLGRIAVTQDQVETAYNSLP